MQDLAHQLRLEIKQLRQQLLREQQEREKDCAVYLQTTRSLRRELDNLQAEVQTERAAVASLGQAKRAAEADYNTAFGRVNALEAELELVRGCYRDLQEEVACHHQAGKAYLSALRSSHGRVRRLEEARYTVVVPGPDDVCLLPDPCCGSGGRHSIERGGRMDRVAREMWLRERRTGLGSSDAAAVCGMSPFGTPLHVYLDKLGLLPPRESERMTWGQRLEGVVADAYAEEKGVALAPAKLARHPNHPWLLCTPDRIVSADEQQCRLLECKTAGHSEGWGPSGTDQVPEQYLIQVQQQMLVTGYTRCDLAVLIQGHDFRTYTVLYDDEIGAELLRVLGEFWRLVEARRPPDPDWSHAETPRLLELLHRPDPAESVELGTREHLLALEWDQVKAEIREKEKTRDGLRARLVEALGSAGRGRLPDGRELERKVIHKAGYAVGPREEIHLTLKKARTE